VANLAALTAWGSPTVAGRTLRFESMRLRLREFLFRRILVPNWVLDIRAIVVLGVLVLFLAAWVDSNRNCSAVGFKDGLVVGIEGGRCFVLFSVFEPLGNGAGFCFERCDLSSIRGLAPWTGASGDPAFAAAAPGILPGQSGYVLMPAWLIAMVILLASAREVMHGWRRRLPVSANHAACARRAGTIFAEAMSDAQSAG
jgi:hypothetical protein